MKATKKIVQVKPLAGWQVLVTRASKQSESLSQPLRELGAKVVALPTIAIHPPRSYAPLDAALKHIEGYDWLILTSVNGVEAMFARLKKLHISVARLNHLKVAAIGPATRTAIEGEGLKVAVTPRKYVAEAVVEALRGRTEGKRVLLVRAKVARDVLPDELKHAGADVDVIEAYETMVPQGAGSKLKKIFTQPADRPDIVTFTSSSTVTNFLALLGPQYEHKLNEVKLASIGPVTSGTLRKAGLNPAIEAREYTMPGLVTAIVEYVHKATSLHLLDRILGPDKGN